MTLSRSQTITVLVNEKAKKLNGKLKKEVKVICEVCKGNGFVRVPYETGQEEQWADCDFCNNQGEIEEEIKEDDT